MHAALLAWAAVAGRESGAGAESAGGEGKRKGE